MSLLLNNQLELSATAQALSDDPARQPWTLVIKAHSANTDAAWLGDENVTASTGYPLYPGEDFAFAPGTRGTAAAHAVRPSDIYFVGTPGDRVSCADIGQGRA